MTFSRPLGSRAQRVERALSNRLLDIERGRSANIASVTPSGERGGVRVRRSVQLAHGFSVGDAVCQTTSGTWQGAQADDIDTVIGAGVVIEATTNELTVAMAGVVPVSLVASIATHWLSLTTAGATTTTEPTGSSGYKVVMWRPVSYSGSVITSIMVRPMVVQPLAQQRYTSVVIEEASHGFVVGDALTRVGTAFDLALADQPSTASVQGVVVAASTDWYELATSGYVALSPSGYALTAGAVHYLSQTLADAGELVDSRPDDGLVVPVLVADDSSHVFLQPMLDPPSYMWDNHVVSVASAVALGPFQIHSADDMPIRVPIIIEWTAALEANAHGDEFRHGWGRAIVYCTALGAYKCDWVSHGSLGRIYDDPDTTNYNIDGVGQKVASGNVDVPTSATWGQISDTTSGFSFDVRIKIDETNHEIDFYIDDGGGTVMAWQFG